MGRGKTSWRGGGWLDLWMRPREATGASRWMSRPAARRCRGRTESSAAPAASGERAGHPGAARLAGLLAVVVLLHVPSAGPARAQGRGAEPVAGQWATGEGAALFARAGCARCHTVRGGRSSSGPDLARARPGVGLFDLAAAMWNHVPRLGDKMRWAGAEQTRLTSNELIGLLAFVFTAQELDVTGDPRAGARVLAASGCRGCHMAAGRGGTDGPSLDRFGRAGSPVALAADLWSHAPRLTEEFLATNARYPRLRRGDLGHLVAFLAVSSRSGGTQPALAGPGTPERGERLFGAKGCARCHGVGDNGDRAGPALAEPAPSASLVRFAEQMWNHAARLAEARSALGEPLPGLSRPEMADTVAYLFGLGYFDRVRGDAGRGRRLVERTGCLGCHRVHGKGGRTAPDLATANVVGSVAGQIAALWNHARFMDAESRRSGRRLPVLAGQELADVATYLASLGVRPGGPSPPLRR